MSREVPASYVSQELRDAFAAKHPDDVGKEYPYSGDMRVVYIGYDESIFSEPYWVQDVDTGLCHRTSSMSLHLSRGVTLDYRDGTSERIGFGEQS